jgi:hypothetical protein
MADARKAISTAEIKKIGFFRENNGQAYCIRKFLRPLR